MKYIHNDKSIEIIANTTGTNNTKITVAKDRITIKVGERHLSLFVREEWALIANTLSEKEVTTTLRGMFQILPHGGHAILKNEKGSVSVSVSYYRSLAKVVVSDNVLQVKTSNIKLFWDDVEEFL